jgi:hypothetical protein
MCVEKLYGKESVTYQGILRLLVRLLCLGEIFAVHVLIGLVGFDHNVLGLGRGLGTSCGRSGRGYVCHGMVVCECLANAQGERGCGE